MQGLKYLAETTGFKDTYGNNFWARFVEKGIPTAILGMLTVFVVLSLIWGCLEIFRYVFYTLPERNKNNEKKESTVKESVTAPEVYEEISDDDGEVVAAIIAAITAARSEESSVSGLKPGGFRVVSFRKRAKK